VLQSCNKCFVSLPFYRQNSSLQYNNWIGGFCIQDNVIHLIKLQVHDSNDTSVVSTAEVCKFVMLVLFTGEIEHMKISSLPVACFHPRNQNN
jgi:hypothetical protein